MSKLTAIKKAIRDKYAWPGGYPLFIVMEDGGALCIDCAKKEFKQIAHSTRTNARDGWAAAAPEVNWEDTDLHSDNCSKKIESAYGENPSRRKKNPSGSDEAVELRLYLENDGELYRRQMWPIIQNIARKMKAGKYDHAKAPKLWGYLVESAAKKYAKEFSVGTDWNKIFSVAVRKQLAQELADDYRDKIRAGEYSIALGRKKNPATRKPDQSDIEAAQRGLRMVAMSVNDLDDLIREHSKKEMFASKVIVLAAKQMRAAKRQVGARRNNPVRPLKGAKRRAKPGAVSKLLAKARETFKALNPGKRVPPSLASKKKRRQKNPAAPRRTVFKVEKKSGRKWVNIGYFNTQADAKRFADFVANNKNVQCRIYEVEL